MNDPSARRRAFRDTLPVMAGYLVLGFGYGVVLRTRGYGLPWALATSLFVYAGAMQYVGVELLSAGASAAVTALTTLLVNARHLFCGISMLERYRAPGKGRLDRIFALTDETYSLVGAGEDRGADYALRVSALDQCYWVAGSVLGSLAGQWLPFDTAGIDFALTALFLTVFIDQWRAAGDHTPALIGVGASVLGLWLWGSEAFLLPSMILMTGALLLSDALRRREVSA